MIGPDRIWAWSRLEWKTDSGTWSVCELPRSTEYIRRDPAVLAALPEVQAMIAEAVAREREACAVTVELCATDCIFEAKACRLNDQWAAAIHKRGEGQP